MKWTFVIQRKFRAMCLLGSIMVVVILGTILSQRNVAGIDQSSTSIYNDRLIPATTIIYMTENLYGKRLALEDHLFNSNAENSSDIGSRLSAYDKSIDSLLSLFGKTYLVDQEVKSLAAFKSRHMHYQALEKQVLSLCASGNINAGKNVFAQYGALKFAGAVAGLNELTDIQSSVGKDLMKESKSNMASFGVISSLQIALAVVIGLMIFIVVCDSRLVERSALKNKNQYFNLN